MEDEDEDSTMEEDNDDIAATYIQTFDSLPQDVQCSVAQAVIPKVRRCAGFRPVVLYGYVDLLTHVTAGGSARCIRVGLAELDEALVQLCDPVVFAVLINRERVTDKERRQSLVKGTVGVGVG